MPEQPQEVITRYGFERARETVLYNPLTFGRPIRSGKILHVSHQALCEFCLCFGWQFLCSLHRIVKGNGPWTVHGRDPTTCAIKIGG